MIAAHFVIDCLARGTSFRPPYHRRHAVLLLLLLTSADVAVSRAGVPHMRLAPWCRPLLVVCSLRWVLRLFVVLVRMVASTAEVAALLVLCLLFYAVTALFLFRDMEAVGHEEASHFATLGDSLWSFFILLTTSNFPDVMMLVHCCQCRQSSCQ